MGEFHMNGLKEKMAHGLFWGGISNGLQQLLMLFFWNLSCPYSFC